VRGLVERGDGASPGGEGGGGRRVVGGRDQRVEAGEPAAQVRRARGLRPVVVQPGARLAVAVRVVDVPDDRTERDRRAARHDRIGSERLAQRPDRRAEAGARGGAVRPEPGGERVAVLRPGMQGQEGQQAQVGARQRHRDAVALDGDVTEELHRQHATTVPA
jgi:hypothetical protein